MPSGLAAQSRQRYGDSRAARKRLPLILASSSRICSMSSRNLRNITQVSIGRRSRSPLSPLSFRMMSRQALTMEERRWAVVKGWEDFDLMVLPMLVFQRTVFQYSLRREVALSIVFSFRFSCVAIAE